MFKYACFFSFICICLFLVACGDGGTSEPILYPEQPLVKSSSSDAPESSDSFSSSGNVSSSSSSVEFSSSEDGCVSGECFFTDERDGQVYRAVRIGDQVWMAQNLNYGGTVPQNCAGEICLGRRYLWSAAMDSIGTFTANGKNCGFGAICSPAQPTRGICPDGWHLPSKADWDTLRMVASGSESIELPFGASERAGDALRSKTGWKDDKNGTDEFKFTVYPNASGSEVTFFLSSEYSEQTAALGTITYERASGGGGVKDLARYIRCIRGKSSKDSSEASQNSIDNSSSSVSVNSSSSSVGLYISYGEMTDERDGHVYKTMTISGTLYDKFYPKQIWMAENLNYAYLQPTSTEDSSSWCGDNDPETCKRYGRLYLWSAAIDSAAVFSEDAKGCGYFATDDEWVKCPSERNIRGICPEEWRLPTYNEYYKLLFWRLRDGSGFAKEQLLEYFEDEKEEIWGSSNFWLATEKSNTMAFRDAFSPYSLEYSEGYPLSGALSPEDKSMVHSVRCVKDVPDIE